MRANTRRRPIENFNPQPTPDRRQFTSRDSDASYASSRPSNIGSTRSTDLYTDRAHQTSAIRSINTYLSSHASLLSLRAHPISSAKEIIEVLQFLLNQLEYPCTKIEDDLFLILKSLNCPYKVNKSTLRAPNTPHNWPSFLALMHWLVQIGLYKENLGVKASAFVENDSMLMYAVDSYVNFMRGDDDFVEALDREFVGKLERERDSLGEAVGVLEKESCELGAKSEILRVKAGPGERERLEKDKSLLEEDLNKFHVMIAGIGQGIEGLERVLEEKKREVEVKVEERKRIDVENEELRMRVEEQSFNMRDAERMKRELMAVERDIGEAESERSSWEEKMWDVDAAIGHKFKEVEALAMECNQAVRRFGF